MARAHRYSLADPEAAKTKLMTGLLKGQTSLIIGEMIKAESPLTVQEIADRVSDRLVTRQDPVRVVGFYISTWKKSNYVVVADEVENTETVQPPATAEVQVETFESAVNEMPVELTVEEQGAVAADIMLNAPEQNSGEELFKVDIAKAVKMKEAVFSAIHAFPGVDTDKIIELLQHNWRKDVGRKQVNDCLLKMAKADEIRREQHADTGHYGFFTT